MMSKLEDAKTKIETKGMTFRLSTDIIDELRRQAIQMKTNPNAIVREVMKKYLRWDVYSAKIGLMPVPKELLSTMIEGLNNEQLQDLVKVMYDSIKDWVIFLKGDYNFNHCMVTLEEYFEASGIPSEYRMDQKGHQFIIRHKMGISWSLFTEDLLKRILQDFVNNDSIKAVITPSTTRIMVLN